MYRVWEHQIGRAEITYGGAQLAEVQFTLYQIQELMGQVASALEKLQGLLCFADPLLSVVAYATALCGIIATCLILCILPARWILAFFGSAAMIGGHIHYDQWESVESQAARMQQELLSSQFGLAACLDVRNVEFKLPNFFGKLWKKSSHHVARVRKKSFSALVQARMMRNQMSTQMNQGVANFFERIPTESELAHRFIATRISPRSPVSDADGISGV